MMNRLMRLFALCCALLLSACVSIVDKRYTAKGQDSRVRYIVLHYTWENLADSLKFLRDGEVSAHYLITDEEPAKIIQLVDESQRAWHAGRSHWKSDSNLNASSIGIEIVNLGPRLSQQTIPMNLKDWQPYSPSQIEHLITLLSDIQRRHHVPVENILAHSDIAPQRKVDPGPAFPWKRLAQAGVARWYDEAIAQEWQKHYAKYGLPTIKTMQEQLQQIGYAIEITGIHDQASQNVLRAFQMRYRPNNYSGQLDTETAAILRTLNQ